MDQPDDTKKPIEEAGRESPNIPNHDMKMDQPVEKLTHSAEETQSGTPKSDCMNIKKEEPNLSASVNASHQKPKNESSNGHDMEKKELISDLFVSAKVETNPDTLGVEVRVPASKANENESTACPDSEEAVEHDYDTQEKHPEASSGDELSEGYYSS